MQRWGLNIAQLLLGQLLLCALAPQASASAAAAVVEESLYQDPQKALTAAEAALKKLPATSRDRVHWEAIAAEAATVLELPEQSLLHAQSGLASIAAPDLATELGQRLLISLAVSQRRTGRLQDAVKTINGVITTLGVARLPSRLFIDALTERADMYSESGNFRAALADLLRAYALAEPTAVNGRRGDVAGYLGVVYVAMRDYGHAAQYFREALASAVENNELVTQSIEEYSLAQVLQLDGQFVEAGRYYKSSREHSKQIDDVQGVAFADVGLAELAINEKHYNQAERLFRSALPIFVAAGNIRAQGAIARGLGAIALSRHQYQKALEQAEMALQIAKSGQAPDPKIESHDLLSQIYLAKGDYSSAYTHGALARQLEKAKLTSARDLSVAGMEERFASERREQENETLRQENKIKERLLAEQERLTRTYYEASAFLMILVGLLVYASYKNKKLSDNLKELALTDALTGIANRRSVMALLEQEFIRARRYRFPLSIAMIDLDQFKSINDKFGHDAGDEVLREFCKMVRGHLRLTDSFGRWGGEEFVIVLPHIDTNDAVSIVERIQVAMTGLACKKLRGERQPSFSAGLAIQTPEDTDVDVLVKRADSALYQAKNSGRNRLLLG